MVAPLVPLATAADFRYLLWLVVASLLAFVLLLAPSVHSRGGTPPRAA
jgi:hypothetical protein